MAANTVIGTAASGNPTSYYNGANYTMQWRNGRELQNLTKGSKKTSYEYDVDGLRNLKTNADGSYSVYYWLGNLLLAEERHTGNSTRVLVFSYDESNSPIGFQFKTNDGPWYYYLYAKNIQGDIVALYRRDINADGTRSATHIANYEYDPWGKLLSIKNAAGQDISNNPDNSANVNPLRYRGYYYDNESGFYYLRSRYYDPSIGRFINADTYASTGQDFIGYNMFAYCGNNPVNASDPTGHKVYTFSFELAEGSHVSYIGPYVITTTVAISEIAELEDTSPGCSASISPSGMALESNAGNFSFSVTTNGLYSLGVSGADGSHGLTCTVSPTTQGVQITGWARSETELYEVTVEIEHQDSPSYNKRIGRRPPVRSAYSMHSKKSSTALTTGFAITGAAALGAGIARAFGGGGEWLRTAY